MKHRKFASLFLAFVLVLSLLAGCGNTSNSTPETQQTTSTVADESSPVRTQNRKVKLTKIRQQRNSSYLIWKEPIRSFGRLFWQMNTTSYGWMPARSL